MSMHKVDPSGMDVFLIKVTDSGNDVRFYGVGSLADITALMSDDALRVSSGDPGDRFDMWHLSPMGVQLHVTHETRVHGPIGHTEIAFTWDHPNVSRTGYVARRESTYYPTPAA